MKSKPKKCKCPCHWKTEDYTKSCKDCTPFHSKKRPRKKKSARSSVIKKLDLTFSDIIRTRDDWMCVKCGRMEKPHYSQYTKRWVNKIMTTSHFFGRGNMGTRWDHKNCDAMCIFCHQKVENHKYEEVEGFKYDLFKKAQLGENRFNLLEYRYSSITKYSTVELELLLKEFQKELQELQGPDGFKLK